MEMTDAGMSTRAIGAALGSQPSLGLSRRYLADQEVRWSGLDHLIPGHRSGRKDVPAAHHRRSETPRPARFLPKTSGASNILRLTHSSSQTPDIAPPSCRKELTAHIKQCGPSGLPTRNRAAELIGTGRVQGQHAARRPPSA